MNSLGTPLVVITTIQPLLLLWIAAISFFLGLAVASAISSGRTWVQSLTTWLIVWVTCTVIGVVGTNLFGISSIAIEYLFK